MQFERKILEKSLIKSNKQRKGTIDYAIFDVYGYDVLYIYGSNEPIDWKYNLMGFLPNKDYHPGYERKADELDEFIGDLGLSSDFIISGHSMGASISLVYVCKYDIDRRVTAFAPAVTHGYFNFKKPKQCEIFFRSWDIVRLSQLFFPYKLPLWPITIKDSNIKGMISDHNREAYINSMGDK